MCVFKVAVELCLVCIHDLCIDDREGEKAGEREKGVREWERESLHVNRH